MIDQGYSTPPGRPHRVRPFAAAIAAAAALVLGSVVDTAQAAEKVRWKVPVAFGTNLPALGEPIVYVGDRLKAASDGDVQIKIFEPGKLVPPFQITEAVAAKKIEAGYTWLGYDQGKNPASALFAAVPFGMEPWEFMAWWYQDKGEELAREIYAAQNLVPILCGIMGPETAGWFRKEITSLEDLKGLKIRFAGLGGKVMERLGASVTLLPGGEIFQALEKGAIDATEFSMPAIDQKLGFDKVVKNNYFPGWHQTFTALHFVVNKDVWDGLSEAHRALIDTTCTAGTAWGVARGEALQGAVIAGFPGKGVTARRLPDNILRELQKVTVAVLEEEAGNNSDFKRVYDSQKAFSENYKFWKSLGYLPRNF